MFASPATSNRFDSARAVAEVTAALRAGEVSTAEALLQTHLAQSAGDPGLLAIRAKMLADQGRDVEAAITLRRALINAPDNVPMRIGLARLLAARGDHPAALAEIERTGNKARSTFEVMAFEAAMLGILGLHERELELYARLVEAEPGNADLWMSYGNALKTVGRTGEAIDAMRRAIGNRRTFGEAYWSLANFKSFQFTDRDLSAMRKAVAGKLDPHSAIHFHFALGRALEERGDFEYSFRHYDTGNRLRAAQFSPAQMSITPRVESALATFNEDLLDRHREAGSTATDPIFVVGLQRSGSTLVEQILACHPLIEGTSELMVMEQLWSSVGQMGGRSGNPFQEIHRLGGKELRALGEDYIARSRAFRATDKPHFVDKLPANWLNIGFIRLILPNARIIDARRHPMACGFSNFKQLYSTGVSFAYSLESIGRFYRDYVRFVDHFDRLRPGMVHRLINEQLIDDPRGEVDRLLDYIGVPFDAGCLEFHRNDRAVRTPSAEQVRRPINRDGVDSWKSYGPWLGPLRQSLGDCLVNWDG